MECLVYNFDSANEPVLALVRVTCINDHAVKRYLLLAVGHCLSQLHVVHFTSLIEAGIVVVCNLVVDYHIIK